MSPCSRSFNEELLSGYLDHALPQVEAQEVRLHLTDCNICQTLYGELRTLRDAARSTSFRPPAEDAWPEVAKTPVGRFSRSLGWLVVIAWLVTVSGIALWRFLTQAGDPLEVFIVLGGIAISFWMIFLTQRGFWWAVIPAGALSSIALVSITDEIIPSEDTGGLFLVGLGLTFVLVANLPGYENGLKWAYIPGGILTAIGVLTLPFMQVTFNILFPLALIGAGGYVLYKNYKN